MERFGLSKEDAIEKINKIKKNIHKWNIYSIEEQMSRYNLTEEQATEKVNNIKNVNVYSVEWQMSRFNLTEDEAKKKVSELRKKVKISQEMMSEFEFNSMIPSKKEHWIKKGFTEEESIIKAFSIIEIAKNNCKNTLNDRIKNPEKYKEKSNTNLEFYLKKGFSEEESIFLLKKRQSTFSLQKCVEKYGFEKGLLRWKERQIKWKKSVEGKINNEMKDSFSFEHFMKKNDNNEVLAKEEMQNVFEKRYSSSAIGRASKESMKIFNIIITWCQNRNLKYYCGVDDSKEFYLFCNEQKKFYAYDFTIPKLKLIFEFHGKFWHSKEPDNRKNELGISMMDTYIKDQHKRKLCELNGFKLVELFEIDGIEYNLNMIFDILNS